MIKQTLDLSGLVPLNRMQIEHLVYLAGRFTSQVLFECGSRTINGKSMLGLLSMGMAGKDPITLIVNGEDEQTAFQEIKKMLDEGVAPPKGEADALLLVQKAAERYAAILGDGLTGIYLHGSLAAGCFHWDRSDIDLLAVAKAPLPVEKKIALAEVLYVLSPEAPAGGFEMSVLLEEDCRRPAYPMPYILHYSPRWQREYERDVRGFCQRMHGKDPDLTAHILCLNAFGKTICGPEIPRLFPPVRREDALSAIRADLREAEESLHEKPVYYVLNLCRAAAYCRENLVLSKKDGGEWALKNMGSAHQRVIQAALNAYEMGLDMSYDQGQAESFCSEALAEIGKK